MKPRPDFFIAGALKCGSTSLFSYLRAHPGVFMPANKEPNYFCADLLCHWPHGAPFRVSSAAEYEALFSTAPPHALTGEASVFYLYSKLAISQIMAHNAESKFIVMLRNPVDAARSLHAYHWNNHLDDVRDFEQAWRLQELRLVGRHVPPEWPYPQLLQYGPQYSYAPQVRRLLAQAPREQCLFVLFEEFFADPSGQFARVLDFLELPPDPGRTAFPVVNQTIGVRSMRLARLLRRPPPGLLGLRRAAHALGFHPMQALQRFNRFVGKRPPLRESFRTELEEYFSADVAELEQLLGRKLWPSLRPTASSLAAQPH